MHQLLLSVNNQLEVVQWLIAMGFSQKALSPNRGDRAIVTSMRSAEYLVLVRELHCSIQKHSPGVRFVVLSVAGDLSASIIQDIQEFAEYREVEELSFPNEWFPRCALLTQDPQRETPCTQPDSPVTRESALQVCKELGQAARLEHDGPGRRPDGGCGRGPPGRRASPVQAAYGLCMGVRLGAGSTRDPLGRCRVPEALPSSGRRHGQGAIPMPPRSPLLSGSLVQEPPVSPSAQVVQGRAELRQPTQMAEQSFLAWYFRYAGLRLPSMYNTNFQIWFRHTGQLTAGGEKPLALHFSDRKLFEVCPADPEWRYLCYRPRLVAAGYKNVAGVACSSAPNETRSSIQVLIGRKHSRPT